MFRRFYIPKYEVLCSEGEGPIPKVLYSEGSIFRRFYIPKVLYSEGSMFRKTGRFYNILKVLCSKISDFVAYRHLMRLWMTDEIERVWVGVGAKIKKSGNVEITARGD